jgi:mannosyltransferase
LGYGGTRGLATVGRVRPEKGTDVFVDSMLQILPKYPDLVALVVGKATKEHNGFQKKLVERVAQASLSDRLIFTGEIVSEKMPTLMRALSLLVALPRYEGYGMTPLEALASGVPFVGSDTGYFDEFSNDGKVGTVVPLEDVSSSTNAIDAWLSDDRFLKKASELASHFVAQQHSLDAEVAGINAVYEDLWKADRVG